MSLPPWLLGSYTSGRDSALAPFHKNDVQPSADSGQSIAVADDAIAAVALGGVEAAVGAPHESPGHLAPAVGGDASRYGEPADALARGALHQVRGHDAATDVIGNREGRAQLNGW